MGLSGNRETSRMLLDISTGYPGVGWERVNVLSGPLSGSIVTVELSSLSVITLLGRGVTLSWGPGDPGTADKPYTLVLTVLYCTVM